MSSVENWAYRPPDRYHTLAGLRALQFEQFDPYNCNDLPIDIRN